MTEANKNARRPFQTAGERLDDLLGDASARIEEETQTLIKYINDELVPAIRQHSTNALRMASEKLQQAADHMDSRRQSKGKKGLSHAELRLLHPLALYGSAAAALSLRRAQDRAQLIAVPASATDTISPTATRLRRPSHPQPTTKPRALLPHSAKPIYVETGLASWYGPPYHHRRGPMARSTTRTP